MYRLEIFDIQIRLQVHPYYSISTVLNTNQPYESLYEPCQARFVGKRRSDEILLSRECSEEHEARLRLITLESIKQ